MAEHELKIAPAYYDAIKRGDKTFEVRRDDRGFQKGDVLKLKGWSGTCYSSRHPVIRCEVLWILTGGQLGIQPGFVVMSIKMLSEPSNDH